MAKMWKNLPARYTKEFLEKIEQLADDGLSKGHIAVQLDFTANAFSIYRAVGMAFDKGRSKLSARVSKTITKNMVESSQDRLYLAKRLRLFENGFDLGEIKDIPSAQKALGKVIQEYTLGSSITEETLREVKSALLALIESYHVTDLSDRIEALEKLTEERA